MLNRQILSVSLTALLGTSLGFMVAPKMLNSDSSNIAVASESRPVMDNNGDYHPSDPNNPHMSWRWEVVDPDPNGLNCRYLNRTEGSPTGSNDFYNYPVSNTLMRGETFNSPQIVYDDRNLPWLWVGSSATNHICFVRANSSFVRPVRALDFRL